MIIKELSYEEDQYFSGFGQRSLAVARIGSIEVERYTDAEGNTTYRAYHFDAMSRAYQRSVKNGGGARGLCSEHLLEGESIVVKPEELVSDVRAMVVRKAS